MILTMTLILAVVAGGVCATYWLFGSKKNSVKKAEEVDLMIKSPLLTSPYYVAFTKEKDVPKRHLVESPKVTETSSNSIGLAEVIIMSEVLDSLSHTSSSVLDCSSSSSSDSSYSSCSDSSFSSGGGDFSGGGSSGEW